MKKLLLLVGALALITACSSNKPVEPPQPVEEVVVVEQVETVEPVAPALDKPARSVKSK